MVESIHSDHGFLFDNQRCSRVHFGSASERKKAMIARCTGTKPDGSICGKLKTVPPYSSAAEKPFICDSCSETERNRRRDEREVRLGLAQGTAGR